MEIIKIVSLVFQQLFCFLQPISCALKFHFWAENCKTDIYLLQIKKKSLKNILQGMKNFPFFFFSSGCMFLSLISHSKQYSVPRELLS